jgi:hypothetical protein
MVAPSADELRDKEEQESESGWQLGSLCFMSQVHDMSVRLMTTGLTDRSAPVVS